MIFTDHSYVFNKQENLPRRKSELVTVSSTIVDEQGIVKCLMKPYSLVYYPLINRNEMNMFSLTRNYQLEVPIENHTKVFQRDLSMVYSWSMPSKARVLQLPTKSSLVVENVNRFERTLMKISIGTQNGMSNYSPSEIALSQSDDTLDTCACESIGILKKKRIDWSENENQQKRFCFNRNVNEEKFLKNLILENVHQCVENLSKILSDSYLNTDEQLTTLQNSYSFISTINNNNNNNHHQHNISIIDNNIHSKPEFYLFNQTNKSSDGIILHRGKQFGHALGEPLVRKQSANAHYRTNSSSSHPISQLNRFLTPRNMFLMNRYQLETIEDLIRLFLERGEEYFKQLMRNTFEINSENVEQLNQILIKWEKQLT